MKHGEAAASSASASAPATVLDVRFTILGDHKTGKTSLVRSYVEGSPMANPGATGGTCERDEDGFFTKTVSWTDPAMTLAIKTWDLADGLKLATTNITKPFKMSKGFFIVFDISNPSTFENVLGWKKQIEQFRSSSDSLPPSIMLVGAKQDLTSSATITYATASGLAKEMQATYVEVSNVTGLGVTECFNTMIQMYFERQNERKRLKLKSSDSDVPIVNTKRQKNGGCILC